MTLSLVKSTAAGEASGNCYLDTNDLDTLMEATTFNAAWKAIADNQVKFLNVILACKYLDVRFRFYGKTYTNTQAMEWPRTKNYDQQGRLIAAGTIPEQIKKAVTMLVGLMITDDSFKDIDTIEVAGQLSSFGTDGLSMGFTKSERLNGPTGQTLGVEGFTQLWDTRIPELEVILMSIGELKTEEFLQQRKQTFIK